MLLGTIHERELKLAGIFLFFFEPNRYNQNHFSKKMGEPVKYLARGVIKNFPKKS